MCILSIAVFNNQTILTFNRDEDATRPFTSPQLQEDGEVFCPVDLVSGGTWIGKNKDFIACLQNGGRLKHKRELPYDKSRGKILLELLQRNALTEILPAAENLNIEPFTITIYYLKSKTIKRLIYENQFLDQEDIGLQDSFIQCSSTLYAAEHCQLIAQRFDTLPFKNKDSYLEFHKNHRIGGPDNQTVLRPATTSITQFVIDDQYISCRFYDMIKGEQSEYQSI